MAKKQMKGRKKRKKKEEAETGRVFQELPYEIGADILSRLPLRTICHCRWVCKTWYDLIRNPNFAKLHYSRSIQDKPSTCIVSCVMDIRGTSTPTSSLQIRKLENLMARFMINIQEMASVGSANGLVCFSTKPDRFYPLPYCIGNLVTGEQLILPNSPKCDICPIASGFGFDSITEKYKVIRILKQNSKFEAEVFALGSNKWRKIRNVPSIVTRGSNSASASVNGCLHWITFEIGSEAIVSFNVGSEKFDAIQLPFYKESMYLGVVGEKLSLITSTDLGDKEIWVMKEYGVEESWTKKYVLKETLVGPNWNLSYEVIELNGELLLHIGTKTLGCYDPQTETFMSAGNEDVDTDLNLYPPIMLVGSLISPHSFRIYLRGAVPKDGIKPWFCLLTS